MTPEIKAKTFQLLQDLADGADPRDIYHADAVAHASHPWGVLSGVEAISGLWSALRRSLPDMERRDLIFVGGENRDDPRVSTPRAPHLVAALGHYQGDFIADLLGIPATHGTVHLRYSEAHWLDGNKIRQSHIFLDLLDLARQAGTWPLPISHGAEAMWPGPRNSDGVRIKPDDWFGPDALETVFKMHDALLSFDGKSLDSMPHGDYWTDRFMYYAGAGIGAMRGLRGFRAHHQIPFLKAFPDRIGTGHFIRISDGPYAVTGGVVEGTHLGPWLGMTPTGRRIRIPVMDFYRLDGDKIAENWLPIDVAGIADQMGNDVIARIRHMCGDPVLTL
jgi:predicted ester cyclase